MKRKNFLLFIAAFAIVRFLTLVLGWSEPLVSLGPAWYPYLEWSVKLSLLFNLIAGYWLFRTGSYRYVPGTTLTMILAGGLIAFGYYAQAQGWIYYYAPISIACLLFLAHYSFYFFKKEGVDYLAVLKYVFVCTSCIGTVLGYAGMTMLNSIAQIVLLVLTGAVIHRYWRHPAAITDGPELSEDSDKVFRYEEEE